MRQLKLVAQASMVLHVREEVVRLVQDAREQSHQVLGGEADVEPFAQLLPRLALCPEFKSVMTLASYIDSHLN